MSKKPSRYHHGNLKEALVERAIGLLDSVPLDQLSLRQLALAEGVTPTAVYKHFRDKEALLTSIQVAGYQRFYQQVYETVSSDLSARDKLKAMGRNYLEFARAKPALFNLLFSKALPRECMAEVLGDAMEACEMPFRTLLCDILTQAGLQVNAKVLHSAAVTAYATAHGFAELSRTGALSTALSSPSFIDQHTVPMSQEELIDEMSDFMVAGIIKRTEDLARHQD